MKLRSLLLFALLVLVGGGLWLLSRSLMSPGARPSIHEGETSEAGGRGAPGVLASPEMAGSGDGSRLDSVGSGELRSSGLTATQERQIGGIAFEGRVEFPSATPLDEELTLLASARTQEGFQDYEKPIDRGGNFRIVLPQGISLVTLKLQGRYLRLDSPQRVKSEGETGIVLEPEIGGRLTGRLLLPPGESEEEHDLGGIKVSMNGPSDRSVDTDASGWFEFTCIEPSTKYTLETKPERYAKCSTEGLEVEEGRTTEADLELQLGVSISGRVTLADGTPIPGVTVSPGMTDNFREAFSGKRVETDELGHYLLRGVEPVEVKVRADIEGLLPEEQVLGDFSHGHVLTNIDFKLREGSAISGFVRWPDGSPAAGAEVALRITSGMNWDNPEDMFRHFGGEQTSAGPDGAFSFTGIAQGDTFGLIAQGSPDGSLEPDADLSLLERKRLAATRRIWRARADEVELGSTGLVLKLAEGNAISGRVVDEQGEPVRRFHVHAELADSENNMWGIFGDSAIGERYRTKDGEFTLGGLHDDTWQLVVSSGGYVTSVPERVELGSRTPFLTLELKTCPSVKGIVLDAEGEPIKGVRVVANFPRGAVNDGWDNSREDHSSKDGSFSLQSLPDGPVTISTDNSDEHAGAEPVRLTLAPGERVEDLQLRMRQGGAIQGTVFLASGEPAIECSVRAEPLDSTGTDDNVDTDGQGKFSMTNLMPGTYTVSARLSSAKNSPDNEGGGENSGRRRDRGNRERTRTVVDVTEGSTLEVQLGNPNPVATQVSGRVILNGEPVQSASFKLRPSSSSDYSPLEGTSAEDGTFSFVSFESGPADLTVSSVRGKAVTEIYLGGGDLALVIELPTGGIAGRVLDGQGNPIQGASVSVTAQSGASAYAGSGETSRNATSDASGAFRFTGLESGQWSVRVEPLDQDDDTNDMMPRWSEPVGTVRSGIVVGTELVEGIDLVLSDGGAISGMVYQPNGRPSPGARIVARDTSGFSVLGSRSSFADQEGHFTVEGLAPGRYTLTASQGDFASAPSSSVTVSEGTSTPCDLYLESATRIIVHTQDASGAALSAQVLVFDSKGNEVSSGSGQQNWWDTNSASTTTLHSLGPFAPGRYDVQASRPDGRSGAKSVNLTGEARVEFDLVLR